MLDTTFRPNVPYAKGDYSLRCPIDSNWADKEQRVLLVIETIDSQDLTESRLLYDRANTVMTRLIQYSSIQAKQHGFVRKDASFAAVNFNNHKFMDKPQETWAGYRAEFAKRIKRIVLELEPTHIIVFGDWAAHALLPDVEYLDRKRGWVFDFKVKGVTCKLTPTLNITDLYTAKKQDVGNDDEDEDDDSGDSMADVYGKSNLLFYTSRNVVNGLLGKMAFDLSHVKVRPVYVDTMAKFKKLYRKMLEAEYAAVDTETKNLTVNFNDINTLQIALDESMRGYVIPLWHPQTPFTEDELAYIFRKLRAFFYAEPGRLPLKYLIFQNGKYDLYVLRAKLGIPIIFHPIWELTAGEWCLDENLKYLASKPFNTPHGGLAQIFCSYGNDHYYTAAFGKEDRANSALTRLDNPDFLEYAAMDVVSLVFMHKMQIERARYLMVGEKNYLPYFKRLVLKQMSNTVHVLSHMRARGSAVDKAYLALLKSNQSPMVKLIEEIKGKLLETDEVKEANKRLLAEGSGQASNRGLFNKVLSVFDFGKAEHKLMLFFSVMGLKPISYTKTKQPQVNVTFIKSYRNAYPVVETFGKYVKLTKLWSTYIKGWWNKIKDSPDNRADWRIRADYGFFPVVTGRLNSFDPSLQQVPTRGSEAKYIKRAFRSPKGTMHVKYDYSAHEVRGWSFVSFDKVLASVFKIGQDLRKALRGVTDPEKLKPLLKAIKEKGDIHILNVKRFFDLNVDKKHPLRDAIKQVVFGVIYGKAAKTLAKDIRGQAKAAAEDKIHALKKEVAALNAKTLDKAAKARLLEIDKIILEEKAKLKELKADDKVELAKSIIAKLFIEFKKAGDWLDWTKQHAREHYYTFSPMGLRRNLFGIMTGINAIVAAMERRAANSPIQGMASQIGITAARLIAIETYKTLMKFGYMDRKTKLLPAEILKAVHDANYSEVPYEVLLIFVHIMQYVATYGVTDYYKEEFKFQFTIEPEIELEFGATEDKAYKWNWTSGDGRYVKELPPGFDEGTLEQCLSATLQDQAKLQGQLDEDPETIFNRIYHDYRTNKELQAYLCENYPILGEPASLCIRKKKVEA